MRDRSAKRSKDGFHGLTQPNVNNETEDQQRENEHRDVKVLSAEFTK